MYHLWLLPDSKNQKKLQKLVDDLSARFRSPRINPHRSRLIRISGNEEALVAKTRELANPQDPSGSVSLKWIG
jgi:hypothetical protein